ncbi:ATP-dependent RNA helicase DHX58-like [Asterias amurensis]|uniref:ATP-dependent RNA helicase DHX58-like n=1 Tax=Asterias amurensis TaxID=7602 RepID=UPI003AB60184
MAASNNCDEVGISLLKTTLYKIYKELNETDFKELRYLCKIPKKAEENMTTSLDLFNYLEEEGKISENNVGYLDGLLKRMGKSVLRDILCEAKKPGLGKTPPPGFPQRTPTLRSSGSSGDGNQPTDLKGPQYFTSPSPPPINQSKTERQMHRAKSASEVAALSSGQSPTGLYNIDGGQTLPKFNQSTPRRLDQQANQSIRPNIFADVSTPPTRGSVPTTPSSGQRPTRSISLLDMPIIEGKLGNMSLKDPSPSSVNDDLQTDSAQRVLEDGASSSRSSSQCSVWELPVYSPQETQEKKTEMKAADQSIEELMLSINNLTEQKEVRDARAASGSERPTLRAYQTELAERPLRKFENHIICAPTGSGKTLTAAFICYQYMRRFQRAVDEKHFKALFIVHMRHLTWQQRNNFLLYFPNKQAVRVIGEQQTFKDALKFDEEMPAVLMLTAQIFVNALKSKSIKINDLDMLIFDECHHTDQKHPFNEIMKTYLKEKYKQPRHQVGVSDRALPFIIGLSASLGVGHELTALGHLQTLCGNMDSKGVVRVLENVEELKRHVNSPDEDTIKQALPRDAHDREFGNLLEVIMLEIEGQLPEIVEHPLPSHGTQLYETEVKRRLIEAESQRSANRTDIIVYMYLYEYNRAMILYDDLRVKDGLRHLEEFHVSRYVQDHPDQVPVEEHCRRLFNSQLPRMKELEKDEGQHSNHKLGELAHVLHQIFSDKPESKGIILATMKVAATALVEFLRSSDLLKSLPCRIEPLRLVGQGSLEDDCLTEAQQKEVLNSFRRDDGCNILVATDIAQEGLDMPACSFVIRYNFVSNEIGTVQSKGRARASGSQCFLIVERNSQNEKREYENRSKVVRMEKAMEELEAMVEEDRLLKIQEKQDARIKAIIKAEEQEKLQGRMHDLEKIYIHCKECSAYICKASELRRKGTAGHVTCISPDFGSKITEIRSSIPQRYRDTETTGFIKCATYTCKKNLGTMQKFLLLDPPLGYALKADNFKIVFSREGTAKVPKQWKKAGFVMLQDEDEF